MTAAILPLADDSDTTSCLTLLPVGEVFSADGLSGELRNRFPPWRETGVKEELI